MSENLILGCGTTAVCLAVQCVVVSILFRFLFDPGKKQVMKTTLIVASSPVVAVMLIMLAGMLGILNDMYFRHIADLGVT